MTDPRDSDSPFGLHDFLAWSHPWNRQHYTPAEIDAALDLMREAGAAWIRLDFIRADIEPELGRYDFSKFDHLVDAVTKRGIKILGLLAYGAGGSVPWPEVANPERFTAYAVATVGRYKDRVRHWEVWNEPDHPMFWQPLDGLKGYAKLLSTAYPAIKATDPTCIVHAAGLSQGLTRSLKNLHLEAGSKVFDVVNVHPFINPLMPDALGGLQWLLGSIYDVMKTNDDAGKELWITQIGSPGMKDPSAAPSWWLGKNPTEVHQAEWVRVLYSEVLKSPGVKKIFWSFFRDADGFFGTGADYSGLIRHDLSKKPAFEAYQKAARATATV